MTFLPNLEGAVCTQTDPELFFPSKGQNPHQARELCASCPVREDCLAFALDNNIEYGIFGGLSPKQRSSLNRDGHQAAPDILETLLLHQEGSTPRQISDAIGVPAPTVDRWVRALTNAA